MYCYQINEMYCYQINEMYWYQIKEMYWYQINVPLINSCKVFEHFVFLNSQMIFDHALQGKPQEMEKRFFIL